VVVVDRSTKRGGLPKIARTEGSMVEGESIFCATVIVSFACS
jgi:hypothetical protein